MEARSRLHLQDVGAEASRKRKAHKKSRLGCRNCKLRRVKCDESRPKCKQCTTFGVFCNYNPKDPDLQMSIGGSTSIKDSQKAPVSVDRTRLGMLASPDFLLPPVFADSNSSFEFDRQSMDRFNRFQTRTVFTIGNAKLGQLYQKEGMRIACLHPYLMHVVQTITAIHDRYLSAPLSASATVVEVYHSSQAAALFNRELSKPGQPLDGDALWATAALLGVITFASIEASTPEEAWPLKSPSLSDLEWLRISDGKKAIWKVADPSTRPDSIFHALADEYEEDLGLVSPLAGTKYGIEGIPSTFVRLCDLSKMSTPDNSPYYVAVHTLAQLLLIEYKQATAPKFFYFILQMQPDFRRLLERKDPRALLLLAYWYGTLCHSQWWSVRRAILECQATCLYLERYHADDTAIQELLHFPKMKCGLEV